MAKSNKPEVEQEFTPQQTEPKCIDDVLNYIQGRLLAPKDKSAGGRYMYRSAEDILARVKPFLVEMGAGITVGDNVISVNNREFIDATASLRWRGEQIQIRRQAELPKEAKKGLDPAQQTGSCSSYAGKYALCGLLAIDDRKEIDPDALAVRSPTISEEQAERILKTDSVEELQEVCSAITTKEGGSVKIAKIIFFAHQASLKAKAKAKAKEAEKEATRAKDATQVTEKAPTPSPNAQADSDITLSVEGNANDTGKTEGKDSEV